NRAVVSTRRASHSPTSGLMVQLAVRGFGAHPKRRSRTGRVQSHLLFRSAGSRLHADQGEAPPPLSGEEGALRESAPAQHPPGDPADPGGSGKRLGGPGGGSSRGTPERRSGPGLS